MEKSNKMRHAQLNPSIGQKLTEIITKPISPYLDWDKTNISYRYTFYTKVFMTRLLEEMKSAIDEPGMHKFLHKIEFNSPEYIQYYQDYMRRQIRDTSPNKTSQTITDFKTFVIQYSDQQAEPLYPQGERLVIVMTRWLDAELARAQHPTAAEPPLTVNQALGETEEIEKAALNGSVKEIGLLLRLGVEADMIDDANIRQICRQASALFSTINTDDPSEKSIYKSFFTPDPIAIEKLTAVLKKALEFLQQPEIPPYVKKDKRGKNPEKD